jgi:tripartite-type tricarboxylate transporter receptor subunit TctC
MMKKCASCPSPNSQQMEAAVSNRTRRSRIINGIVLTALVAVAASAARAQADYPNRTIKIVVPIPPGGGANTVPRIVAEKLSSRWGQPIVIENRPGAGLNIGAQAVANAEPDGYTLLATPPAPLVPNRFLYSNLGFDPDAFVPVTILAKLPMVLVVRPNLPVSTLQQLIVFAKANPDKLTFASSGSGTTSHLGAEMLKAKAGIRLTHVPYKGLTPALTDVVAGHVDMMLHDFGSTFPLIRDGKLKALGVGSEGRNHELPDVPAISEIYADFVATTWYAIVAPPKTSTEIAVKLSRAVAETLLLPDVVRRLHDLSMTPVGSSPAETALFLKQETERMRELIAAARIKPE